jgi:hypothetical protein
MRFQWHGDGDGGCTTERFSKGWGWMRATKHFLVSVVLSMLAVLMLASPVAAGRVWCAIDPVVSLNGTTVQILVAVPDEYVSRVNGAVAVDVRTAQGAQRSLISTDPGFNGFGEVVTFSDFRAWADYVAPMLTQISVTIPVTTGSPARIPVQVTVIQNGITTVTEGSSSGTTVTLMVQPTV